MSNFKLSDLGEGRFDLSGDVSFKTAEAILRESEKCFAPHDAIEVDLSAIQNTDSAGLALLLEWVSQAARQGREIRFAQIPEKIQAIAVTAEIDDLLQRSYSSSDSSANSSSSSKK
ncbi:MAG: STAS domain-containing protein [Woeseiaceae bacterium]